MKKSIIALSVVAAMSTTSFGAKLTHDDLKTQIEMLKKQIDMLESKINTQITNSAEVGITQATEKRITAIEKNLAKNDKKLAKTAKKLNKVKAHDAGDNIKWNVDLRTQVDNIQYKLSNGTKAKNNALMTNRLWLGMKFQADDQSSFYGTLSYNKAFGDTASHSQSNVSPGYANFDWVTNENALDNTLNVKEAYWLYRNESFMGNEEVSWTASVGRRPSTDGLGISLRSDQKRKSALSHTVNVEFDGASARFNLDQLTGIEGMWLKFCGGRGLTNAKPRFSDYGVDYSNDDTKNPNIDMLGFIFVPYDDGQYSIHTNYAKAWNVIGFTNTQLGAYQTAATNYAGAQTGDNYVALLNATPSFNDVGDIEFATVMLKVDGIGTEISDYLDDTTVFASYAMSKTNPNSKGMLGSTDSKTGHSFWIGANAPCPISPEDTRIGLEWNKGSKYWRSMTYGEDSFSGSKIATRGTAWEIYRNAQLTKALSWSLRLTKIDYDYSGSNSFFGAEGNPDSTNPYVTETKNITANIRYRF